MRFVHNISEGYIIMIAKSAIALNGCLKYVHYTDIHSSSFKIADDEGPTRL